MSISALSALVRKETSDFAWRQWRQLGLSGYGGPSDRWAIDPEALILFTTEIARRDPRLFDEMLDWISANNGLLSLQRLRNLTRRFPIDPPLVEAVIEWVAQSNPAVRWPRHPTPRDRPSEEPLPLFAPVVVSFITVPDPVFADHGYLRPIAKKSGKSMGPDLRLPSNLGFTLRLLFGPGARSEIIRVLLTQKPDVLLDAARIANEAGFAKRNVNDALTALADSGAVQARRTGNQRTFRVYPATWAQLLGRGVDATSLPEFRAWVALLPAIMETALWLERMAVTTPSDYLLSSQARDLISKIGPRLDEIAVSPHTPASHAAEDYLHAFEGTVRELVGLLQTTPAKSHQQLLPDGREE